jgi:hypothetical protein
MTRKRRLDQRRRKEVSKDRVSLLLACTYWRTRLDPGRIFYRNKLWKDAETMSKAVL